MAAAERKHPFLSGFLVGLFSGLALAVIVAVLVARNNPFVERKTAQDVGATLPATPATPIEAPKYDYYSYSPTAETGANPPPATPVSATVFFLQAGAYGNAAQAEQMKARLALLGFEATILRAEEGGATLYKVRIGPYQSLDELNPARDRLTQNGVETMLVKIDKQVEKP